MMHSRLFQTFFCDKMCHCPFVALPCRYLHFYILSLAYSQHFRQPDGIIKYGMLQSACQNPPYSYCILFLRIVYAKVSCCDVLRYFQTILMSSDCNAFCFAYFVEVTEINKCEQITRIYLFDLCTTCMYVCQSLVCAYKKNYANM